MEEFQCSTAVALGAGLLIGAERERATSAQARIAKLRRAHLALVSLLGVFSS